MFAKVLVANRGEIAVRIVRALEELGVAPVGVYSPVDRDALHARRAPEAYLLPDGYLDVERILEVVRESGAEAVHPGYGFLAENAAFAKACEDAGIVFIGPPAGAIEAMGSKTRARELMQAAGVPIVPGTTDPVPDLDAAREAAEEIGYPVAVKAAAGGGGKGFRVAATPDDLQGAFEGAAGEGERFFTDPTVYLERYLPDPRHVEVQVLADAHGHTVHLGERDCSIQRRHQKLIEEAPAPVVDDALRERIGTIATDAAEAVGYRGAGTIEGLFQDGEYFFLEMNTRVQVEHCVTEMVTGIDIVKEGIRVAAGEPLSFTQDDVVLRGHAIECRINAEDARAQLRARPRPHRDYREPSGPGVRVDSGVIAGGEISPSYDPMIAKLIVWDADRERRPPPGCSARWASTRSTGSPRSSPSIGRCWPRSNGRHAQTCRDLLEDAAWLQSTAGAPTAAPEEPAETVQQDYTVEVSGRRFDVRVIGPPSAYGTTNGTAARKPPPRARRGAAGAGGGDALVSPMQGTVLRVAVEQGASVEEGALVAVVEAMKMENEITAHKAGTVSELPIEAGGAVATGDTLAVIT